MRQFLQYLVLGIACLLLIFIFQPIPLVQAAEAQPNAEIICTKTECTSKDDLSPFFTGQNIVPGQEFTRTVTINNKNQSDGCRLSFAAQSEAASQPAPDIAQKMLLQVITGGKTIASTNLSQLFSQQTSVPLDILNPKTDREYLWKLIFEKDADNSYQGATTSFELDIHFTCAATVREPTPTPTPTSTPTASPTPASCKNSPPAEAPVLTVKEEKATTAQKQLRLDWKTSPGSSHYSLTFGTTDGSLLYQDIQLTNASHHTLPMPDQKKSYFFQITPHNGCAKGPPSNQVVLDLTKLAASSTPSTIQNQKKTANDENEALKTATSSGSVLGATIDDSGENTYVKKTYKGVYTKTFLYFFILLIIVLLLLLIFIKRRRKKETKQHIDQ